MLILHRLQLFRMLKPEEILVVEGPPGTGKSQTIVKFNS